MRKARRRGPFSGIWWVQPSGYQWRENLEPSGEIVQLDLDGSTVVRGKKPSGLPIIFWPLVEYISGADDWLTLLPDEQGDSAPYGPTYDPLQVIGLHRRFADLPMTEESILAFACEFGLLGRQITRLRPCSPEDILGERPFFKEEAIFWGESLDTWKEEINGLKIMLALWEALESKSPVAETKVRSIVNMERRLLELGLGYEEGLQFPNYVPNRMCQDVLPDPAVVRSGADSWRELGKTWLEAQINRCLAEGTRPAIEARAGAPVYILPRDLLGAIHIMLAEEITGQAGTTIKCRACGKYFFPEHGRQIYCDDRCKFKAYRQRKKENEDA